MSEETATAATEPSQTTDATATTEPASIVDAKPAAETEQTEQTAETTETTTETADATKADGESLIDADDKDPGAPEAYEAFTVPEGMPEGFEMDEQVIEAVKDVSRHLNLSQAKAQRLIDTVWPVIHEQAQAQLDDQRRAWFEESKAHQRLGGEKFEENRAQAAKAVDAFGSPDFRQLLVDGLGNHPLMFEFLHWVGGNVSEGKFVGGTEARRAVDLTDRAAVAKAMYPEQK